ncbi:MAG: 2-amino-4-hydroxy-6-hydroxymethyldihydropteridine diphosphokinase [Chitinophagia bacterium]|nr:2-amino-4-hydroxy-6-hydroxymethyldihydropteridine diphosphokinase [Chitinophagia bacterium]NCA29445.1 2-amino-4-hydroxy-6-hydroxymethyldihydropteridine diphosphokinase [Chitinophagia bacterium]NDD16874.1 2-amino-4-hydroxy-6-hydroxymethyldihydropteridine diphosphokinase [Chitinophagia bacterium]
MNNVYLLIGGNMGDRMANLACARDSINIKCGSIISSSSIYETEAWGYKDQPTFLNQALALETTLEAEKLLEEILKIEIALGRKREIPLGPRNIDIDIIYYNNEIIDTSNLTIPHPSMAERKFVLLPLTEIAGSFIHPILQKTNEVLLKECGDSSVVYKKSSE